MKYFKTSWFFNKEYYNAYGPFTYLGFCIAVTGIALFIGLVLNHFGFKHGFKPF